VYRVTVRDAVLLVEVAVTDAEQERGLMFRSDVPVGTGMLFLYPSARELSFWMKNTYVPLSLAYLDDGYVITQIEDMEPLAEESHASDGTARAVLEVPQGWFESVGVVPGDRVTVSARLRQRFPELVPETAKEATSASAPD
jgi:uncharacterized membrane protein (UPF0127 family)